MIGKMVPLHPNVDVCHHLQMHQLLILKSISIKYLEFLFIYFLENSSIQNSHIKNTPPQLYNGREKNTAFTVPRQSAITLNNISLIQSGLLYFLVAQYLILIT